MTTLLSLPPSFLAAFAIAVLFAVILVARLPRKPHGLPVIGRDVGALEVKGLEVATKWRKERRSTK